MDLLDLIKLVLSVFGSMVGMVLNITGNVVYHTIRIGMLFKNEKKKAKRKKLSRK